tara:strand:- start:1162 stop:1536 length:375 start_codon:yes stop_codon:yes gene_type:complete
MQTLHLVKVVFLIAILGLTACEKNEQVEDKPKPITSQQSKLADTIYYNGKVITINDDKVVFTYQEEKSPLVGADTNEHGCIGSAGYQWCASIKQCVRPWELAKAQNLVDNSVESVAAFCEVKAP